ncbi:hypothetical protein ACIHAA_07910 [Streptomyces sp. NPDC052040]|uniref:hypothetical protein n=1 Tax=unclassified Streptomyces TaxID=2593676 RepID=UPI0037D146E2
MRVLRRIRRPRLGRPVAATGLLALAVGGITACQPGDMSSAAAAYTTDQTATRELQRHQVNVQWLSCTGGYGSSATPAPSETTVVSVDCQGKTDSGQDISVRGRITRVVDGRCVRGDLRATVGGRERFHVTGLGNCDAAPTPTYRPPGTYRPAPGEPGPTVTVTRTIWCQGDPTCWPVQGK